MKPGHKSVAGTIYTCPMHPDVQRGGPGKCPKCGMQLVPKTVPGKVCDMRGDQNPSASTIGRRRIIVRIVPVCYLIGIGLIGAACQAKSKYEAIATQDIREGKIVIESEGGTLKYGLNDLIVEFQDRSGNLLPIENLQMSAAMAMPNTSPMIDPVIFKATDAKGRYTTQHYFGMMGTWKCEINYRLPSGPGKATLDLVVR